MNTGIKLDLADLRRAEELATRLQVEIPSTIDMRIWMLPLLEAIVERIEQLEAS